MKKILILTANPKTSNERRLEQELREIREGLRRSSKSDQFEIVAQWAVRPSDLRRALLDHEPQIVHFSGYGAGSKGLALVDDSNDTKLVSASSLAELFELFKDKVECVILNACYSDVQATAIYEHISCVIGMNQAIGDRAAIEFAVGFYDGLGAGRSYGEAFRFGRSALDLEGIPESETPQLKQRTSPKNIPQPRSSAQAEPLESVEGSMDAESRFYIQRDCDKITQEAIRRQGVTLTIKGPRQMGKSSLLIQTMSASLKSGKSVAFLDFQQLDKNILQSADAFYRQFCQSLTEQLFLSDRTDDYWDDNSGYIRRCTRYMQTHVLPEVGGPLMIAMDEVDWISEADYCSDFFSMLRSWHNYRASPTFRIWKQLDLALVTATDPYHLIPDLNKSPFNVGELILLTDFTATQVSDLNHRHGNLLTTEQEQRLMELLNGHPYLVRLALYSVASQRFSVETLFSQAFSDRGPFGAHLSYYLHGICAKQELAQGLLKVIRSNSCPDERVARLLSAAGLVRRNNEYVLPRCQLYAVYFGRRLNV